MQGHNFCVFQLVHQFVHHDKQAFEYGLTAHLRGPHPNHGTSVSLTQTHHLLEITAHHWPSGNIVYALLPHLVFVGPLHHAHHPYRSQSTTNSMKHHTTP